MATRTAAKKPPFQIVNSGTGHFYKVNGETAKGRGVTTLLSTGMPSGGLVKWAAKAVATEVFDKADVWEPLRKEGGRDAAFDFLVKAPDRDRDTAGGRGTEVHKLAQALAEGKTVEVPEPLEGMVDQYLAFRETWQPEDERLELVGANLTRSYFGRMDAIATLAGWNTDGSAARVLYDIKTSRSGPFEKDGLQVNAYANFEFVGEPDDKGRVFEPEPMEKIDGLAILHLSSDNWRLIPVEYSPRMFAMFLHVAHVADFCRWSPKQADRGWGDGIFAMPALEPFDTF